MDIELLLDHTPPSPHTPVTVRALVRVSGQAPEKSKRTPLNLALVLDRSGSMYGEKLENARAAAALLVRRLWPEDRVSVVAYCSEVTTLASGAEGEEQERVESLIRAIQTGGTTNLSGGWLQGRDLVQEARFVEGVNRVILLTDGLANQGITDPETLTGLCRKARKEGVTTTTIGFGEDFDEDLLRAMADAGGGAAYYIENPDQAPGIFEEEVEGLLSLAAQNVTLQVTPAEGVASTTVRHSYPATPVDGGIRLDVGDLYAREPRLVLMEFRLEEVSPGQEVEVGSIRVQGHVLTRGGGVETRCIDLPVRLRVGEGPLVDPEVRRVASLLDAADARKEAIRLREEGDRAHASQVLCEAAETLALEGADDEEVAREATILQEAALRMESGVWGVAEQKYAKQEAHDLGRSRALARERYQRDPERS